VEPDVRNEPIAALNAAAGFQVLREVELPDKMAALSVLTREEHAASPPCRAPDRWAEHLTPEHMAGAQRALLAKAIAEYCHERLLHPEPEGAGRYRLPGPRSTHHFTARVLDLEHWLVDPDSIVRVTGGEEADPDVLDFVAEHAEALGIPASLLPTYLEE